MITLLVALLLAIIHFAAGRLGLLDRIPRSRWLSAAGGAAVAFVFVHLLPAVERSGERLANRAPPSLAFLEHHAYVLALTGLLAFYGLELASRRSRDTQGRTRPGAFWLSIGSFALYNATVGYLLVRGEEARGSLWGYGAAMALHFVVNDDSLRRHHRERYDRVGRWVLAFSIVAGWALGQSGLVYDLAPPLLMSFLSGGILLNVMKEEVPADRRSAFGAFLAGALAYATLLLVVL